MKRGVKQFSYLWVVPAVYIRKYISIYFDTHTHKQLGRKDVKQMRKLVEITPLSLLTFVFIYIYTQRRKLKRIEEGTSWWNGTNVMATICGVLPASMGEGDAQPRRNRLARDLLVILLSARHSVEQRYNHRQNASPHPSPQRKRLFVTSPCSLFFLFRQISLKRFRLPRKKKTDTTCRENLTRWIAIQENFVRLNAGLDSRLNNLSANHHFR